MNNIFNLRRFGNFALLNYWCHKKQYFFAALFVMLLMLLIMFQFRFVFTAKTWDYVSPPTEKITDFFSIAFYTCFTIYTVWIISISMQGINGRSLTIMDMLIPVSNFERYLFAILNSTVVAVGVYILLFKLVGCYAQSFYLYNDSGYLFKGFWGFNEQFAIKKGFDLSCNIPIEDVITNGLRIEKYTTTLMVSLLTLIYLSFISIFMWGEITFQNRLSVVLTILLHVAIFIAIMVTINNIGYKTYQSYGALNIKYDMQQFWEKYKSTIIHCFYIVPLIYQWVIWKKIKNLSLTK